MNINEKYSILVQMTEEMIKNDLILSKISLHQLAYILQEIYSISDFYDFKLYTYGPYSVDLTADLDYLFAEDILIVEYCQGPEYFGSKITLGENYTKLLQQNSDFLLDNKIAISQLIKSFGNNNARSLELIGTIIYFYLNEGYRSLDKIATRIQVLKPYFKEDEIKEASEKLKDELNDYLN